MLLCGFRDLVERLIAAQSPDVNIRGGSHTTALHAASVKGHFEVALLLVKTVQILTLVTILAGLRFTDYHTADRSSWRSHPSKLRAFW